MSRPPHHSEASRGSTSSTEQPVQVSTTVLQQRTEKSSIWTAQGKSSKRQLSPLEAPSQAESQHGTEVTQEPPTESSSDQGSQSSSTSTVRAEGSHLGGQGSGYEADEENSDASLMAARSRTVKKKASRAHSPTLPTTPRLRRKRVGSPTKQPEQTGGEK